MAVNVLTEKNLLTWLNRST